MLRVRLQKLGSLLGLFAIVLAVLAPTVSQVIASHDRLSNALATYCTADGISDSPGQDGEPAHSGHSGPLHWQACAYCGLLVHVPAVPSVAVPLALTLSVARASMPLAVSAVRIAFAHTAAQPRAPPVFS